MIFSRTRRDFGVKTFFLVSQYVSFILKKQTGKNVGDIAFKVNHLGFSLPSDNFLSEVSLKTGMLHNPSCLDILKISFCYNWKFNLLDAGVSQYKAFLPQVEDFIRGIPINQFIECLIVPTFIVLDLAGLFVSIMVNMHTLSKNYLRFGNRHFGGASNY